MFNDLTGTPNQTASKVDDIFADTDKASAGGQGGQIETRRVGLSANPSEGQTAVLTPAYEEEAPARSNKWLKIAIFAVVGAVLILGGYLVYSKFLSGAQTPVEVTPVDINKQEAESAKTVSENNNNSFVTPVSEQNEQIEATSSAASSSEEIPAIPGVNAPATDSDADGLLDEEEIILGTNASLIDSDFDTLSDYDEVKIHKSDPLKSDSDGDGLSDYEEVKIYKTNPLNVDSDGDTYSDFSEIKSGYNPNGTGKLIN
jgi:hypothetical protein